MLRLRLPPKTTEVLGEEASAQLAQWVIETIDASRDDLVARDEFRQVLSRLDIIEHDLEGVKERLSAIEVRFDARFDAMEERFDARFDRLQSDINARLDTVNARFDAVNARFDTMEERFDARFDRLQSDMNTRMDTIHDVVRSQTRWLIATLIALGGLISVLITIFEFIK